MHKLLLLFLMSFFFPVNGVVLFLGLDADSVFLQIDTH